MKTPAAFSIFFGFLFLLTGCDSTDAEPEPVILDVKMAENIPADPASGRDPDTGASISNNLFTLYDLEAGSILIPSSQTDAATRQRDSTSTAWDIGFKGTTIIFNGGTSGPGEAAAQILAEPFAEVIEAPEGGYITDGENTSCPEVSTPVGPVPGSPYAICTGSDNGWYNYNAGTNAALAYPRPYNRTQDSERQLRENTDSELLPEQSGSPRCIGSVPVLYVRVCTPSRRFPGPDLGMTETGRLASCTIEPGRRDGRNADDVFAG